MSLTNEKKIWDFFKSKGLNDYAVSGIMGNLYAESGLKPNNLEDTYNRSLGMTDDEYAIAVNNGSYTKEQFIKDCAGWGLAQWTYHTRKKALYEFAKSKNKSITDLEAQLEFLYKELSDSYKSVLSTLKTATTVKEASNVVLLKFECPADQSVSVQNKRASYGQNFYNKYAEKGTNVTMGVKTYQENIVIQLNKNFNSYEFRCGLGRSCSCSTILIDDQLVEYLQKIRDHFGKPVTITSAYRCPSYNKSIGSGTGSYHSKGMAADIQVAGVAPREVAKYCESIGILGIGLYESDKDGYFVHIDTRTTKYFWYGQAQAYRSTFGGAPLNKPTTSTTTAKPTVKPVVIDKIDTIKEVQAWLNKNYLSVIGEKLKEDGKYGVLTKTALTKVLQKALGFRGKNIDGIYGDRTNRAVKSLKIGSSGEIVKILQAFLVCNGYTSAYVDGSYGNGTAKAVESYQKAKGLFVDGKAGKETFGSLCK